MAPQVAVQSYLPTDLETVALIVAAALVLWTIVYQLWLYPYFLSPIRNVPGPRGSLLDRRYVVFGEFPEIMRTEAGILQRKWAKEYGPTIRAVGPFGISRMMFLNASAMHKVLNSDWIDYPRPNFLRNILGVVAGYGLLTVTGDEHRQMRRFINPAFSISSLTAQAHMYYKPLYDLVDILKSKITNPSGSVLYAYNWMSTVTLDIICLTAFGYECNNLRNPHNELADAYHKLIELQNGRNLARVIAIIHIPGAPRLIASEWLYNHRHWLEKLEVLAPLATLVDSMHRIKRVSAQILADASSHAEAVAASDKALAGKKDVMSLLVQARMNESGDGPGYKMSDDMLIQQVLTFLGAGHETTASGLTWTLWLLATQPEVQAKLREAIAPVLAENPTPDLGTLRRIEYLDWVVMESLRVLPPVPMTIRQAGKSDYIDGVYVPKGTLFYIAIRVINTYKGFWGEDAEEFRPERWGNLKEAPNYHPLHSFQTFINGPHQCIGKTMAIVEMMAILAVIIDNFEFAPAYDGQIIHPTAAVTMKPADNMPLLVRPVKK